MQVKALSHWLDLEALSIILTVYGPNTHLAGPHHDPAVRMCGPAFRASAPP